MSSRSKQLRLFFLLIILISLGYILIEFRQSNSVSFDSKDKINSASIKESSCNNISPSRISKYDGPIDKSIRISHSDPKVYKGPVVEGWGPNVSRDVKIFARPNEDTTLLKPSFHNERWCESTKMIILQHSRPDGFANRMDNRRTWMNFMKEIVEIRSFFVIGHPSGPKAARIQERIVKEHQIYGDILQIDFIEHPNNNTLKTILALKFILSVNSKTKPAYVMKTDDDVYLNLPLYKKILFGEKKMIMLDKSAPMIGFLYLISDVLVIPPEKLNETYTDYLICPSYMYNETSYPTFTSGSGYIIPWWAIHCIYQESFSLPYFFIEDVYIGGFLADRCKIKKIEITGYNPLGKEESAITFKEDLLIHYVDHSNKFNIHRIMTGSQNKELENI